MKDQLDEEIPDQAPAPSDPPPFRLADYAVASSWGIGGVHLGTMCHNGVLTEVYADFDHGGVLTALHHNDIGSC